MIEDQLTGIILSGGKSSRMGKEKGLVDFQGKPLISYAINAIKPLVNSIIIGANNELNEYQKLGYKIVEDEVRHIGPLGGILSALRQSDTMYNIILSCDMPFINKEALQFMNQQRNDYDIVVAAHNGNKIEPLCGIYSKNTLPIIENAIENGNYKLRDIFGKVSFATVNINASLPFYSDKLFYNINKPEDIRR